MTKITLNKKVIIILIFMLLSINLLAKKELKHKSIFVERGNRAMTYAGVTNFIDLEKVSLNIGGDYLFNFGNEFFAGFNFDSSILKYKFTTATKLIDITSISAEGLFEFYSEKNYSFDAYFGLGLSVLGIFSWDDYWKSANIGVIWNYKKGFIKLRYTLYNLSSQDRWASASISFGFLIDMRPKKLNKGYYNDEF